MRPCAKMVAIQTRMAHIINIAESASRLQQASLNQHVYRERNEKEDGLSNAGLQLVPGVWHVQEVMECQSFGV